MCPWSAARKQLTQQPESVLRSRKNCSSFLHLTSSCCTQLNKLKTLLARKILCFYDRQTSSCLASNPTLRPSPAAYAKTLCLCAQRVRTVFPQFSQLSGAFPLYSNVFGSLKESSSCVCVWWKSKQKFTIHDAIRVVYNESLNRLPLILILY